MDDRVIKRRKRDNLRKKRGKKEQGMGRTAWSSTVNITKRDEVSFKTPRGGGVSKTTA